jgi:hypothetical protein
MGQSGPSSRSQKRGQRWVCLVTGRFVGCSSRSSAFWASWGAFPSPSRSPRQRVRPATRVGPRLPVGPTASFSNRARRRRAGTRPLVRTRSPCRPGSPKFKSSRLVAQVAPEATRRMDSLAWGVPEGGAPRSAHRSTALGPLSTSKSVRTGRTRPVVQPVTEALAAAVVVARVHAAGVPVAAVAALPTCEPLLRPRVSSPVPPGIPDLP